MQKILLIDNYDSFTHNLLHYLAYNDICKVDVIRHNKLQLESVKKYDSVVISPGAGLPKDRPELFELLEHYSSSKKILGVCLGHQTIAEFYGAKLKNLAQVYHGISSSISILNSETIFKNINQNILVGRYHSWVVDSANFPAELEVTAIDIDKNIMAFRHKNLNIQGIQFHPESILTQSGLQMVENWILM